MNKVRMEIKDFGVIDLELYPKYAPITVNNFLKLVDENFYDNLTFHRIISGFMIQGGDPLGDGTGGSKENIKGEFLANGIDNPLKHTRGVISMARTNNPNSASSQFFIMHQDAPYLDGMYAAFGKVIKGIEVVDKIKCFRVRSFDEGFPYNASGKRSYQALLEEGISEKCIDVEYRNGIPTIIPIEKEKILVKR